MILENINDEDIVCFGEQGDVLGRNDKEIVGVEKRNIGFDTNDAYKVLIVRPYCSNGTMKFWY